MRISRLIICVLIGLNEAGNFTYNQLSRKRPLLVHEKVVAYERWPLTGTIDEISPKLYRITNSNYYIKLLPH